MASEVIRNVVINLAIKQQEAKLVVPQSAVDAATKPVEAIAKRLEEVKKSSDGAGLKIGDALKQGGEGAFTAARGFAFLFTSTDDGYRQLIANISAAQGAFDLTKGGFEIVKGGANAMNIAAASGGVYAVAMGAVATAQTAVAVTAAAAGTAVKSLFGPLGIALSVVTGLVYLLRDAWASTAESEKKAAEFAKPLITDLDLLAESLGKINQAKAGIELGRELAGLDTEITAAEKLAKLDERRAAARKEFEAIDPANAIRVAKSGDADASAKALEILQASGDIHKSIIDMDRERLSLLKDQQSALQQNLDKQNSIAEAAKDAANQERNRVASLQESIGRLDAIQRAELQKLGQKVKAGGTLSDEEAKRIGELGGSVGKDFESQYFQKKGAGQENILAPFNNGVSLSGQGSKLEEMTRKETEEVNKFIEMNQKTIQEFQALNVKKMQSAIALSTEIKNHFAGKLELEMVREEVEKLSREQNTRNVGRKP